jgi:hypothetical protein
VDERRLLALQRRTFRYFLDMASEATGLVADSTRPGAPSSIAATGFALAVMPTGVERGYLSREEAVRRVLRALRFLWSAPQSEAPDATGHRGLFFHFLDMQTGRRAWQSELSTIDSAILLAGAIVAGVFFDGPSDDERELRALADALYLRADWSWARDGGATLTHGWRPKRGFLRYRWLGYDEALILHILALGSPTHPIDSSGYEEWTSTFSWRRVYGREYLHAGPLFIHQLSHAFVDLREIRDDFMRARGIDYFENSRRATYTQRDYAIRNPRGMRGYDAETWGVTASDGPGRSVRFVDGRRRRFFGYAARGVPFGPDDGTLSPWAVVASLPFAPEIVLPALDVLDRDRPEITSVYGFKCSFNPTFDDGTASGWVSDGYFGLDQGPVVLMIENHLSGLVWELSRRSPYLVAGLERAGFAGGWLDDR